MTDGRRRFVLAHQTARDRAVAFVKAAPHGWEVIVRPKTRSLEQSAKFHALCADIANSGMTFGGRHLSATDWKLLIVSGHAIATGEGSDIVAGLEGERVNLRESTAQMTKARSSSLLDYALAFCAANDIKLTDS